MLLYRFSIISNLVINIW